MVKTLRVTVFVFLSLFLSLYLSYADGAFCTRVIDGDTIIVKYNEKTDKIRLIGVDTPETVHPNKQIEYFGKEASEFTKRMVEGKPIRLEFDWQERDKYGRSLAYVFLQDGTFLNREIIKRGYGHAYTKFPFKYLDDFRKCEEEARTNSRGLWASNNQTREEIRAKIQVTSNYSADDEDTTVYITRTGSKYHRGGCRYLKRSKIPMSLKDAVSSGYAPCKVCSPPILAPKRKKQESDKGDITVYVTRTGKRYHRRSCRYGYTPMKLKDAVGAGYTPCRICNPPTLY